MLNAKKGFTLSELLVSLAVLGLIAAFAVPKVLSSVGNSAFVANAKEAVATISAAFDTKKASLLTTTGTTSVSALNVLPVNGNMACSGAGTTFNYPGGPGYTSLALCNTGLAGSAVGYSMIGSMLYTKIGAYTTNGANLPDGFASSLTVPVPAATNAVQFANGAIIAFNGNDIMGTDPDSAIRGTIVFAVDADGIGTMKPFNVVLGADGRVLIPAGPVLAGPLASGYGLTLGGTALVPITTNAVTQAALGTLVNS